MPLIVLNECEQREPISGFRARFVHSANMTLAYWDVQAGAILPEHSHPHEQVASVLDGQFELTIAQAKLSCSAVARWRSFLRMLSALDGP